MQVFKNRWRGEGGFHELLVMAVPLILSTASWSVQHFVDRMFLAWYSPEAIAAVMPAGILNFTLLSLFIGTAGYVSVFVAQYYGAERPDRIGPSLWQGVYIAVIGGILLVLTIPAAGPFFGLIGHDPGVREYEVIYYQVLCFGAFPAIAASSFSGFFTGLGKPWPVMWVNVFATTVNLVLDWFLIFGHGPFTEMGIKGAAIATVIANFCYFSAYLLLLARAELNKAYRTIAGWRPDRVLLRRLLRFGLPSGIQFFIDVAGFTAFLLLVGRLGTESLAATNIAFNINTLAFMPMIGFGIAVSVLVGQYLGGGKPHIAQRSVYSGFYLTFIYMSSIALLYVAVPDIFIMPFGRGADAGSFSRIREMAVLALKFVAVYSVFDTLNIIFASALKGAGDTRFVMYLLAVVSSVVLVVPTYLALVVFNAGLYTAWTIASAYVSILGLAFFFRFLGGKWKSMRVIEEPAPCLPPVGPELPATRFEL
ncbi:MAG TPA: MATE family efflux transporter [Spirochaetes bacterium]|nr:MATE family efflux transporter [Spirochaetota bacterium]